MPGTRTHTLPWKPHAALSSKEPETALPLLQSIRKYKLRPNAPPAAKMIMTRRI